MNTLRALGYCLLLFAVAAPTAAQADDTIDAVPHEDISTDSTLLVVQGEGAFSYLSEISTYEGAAGTVGYGGRAGFRWGDWGAFLQLEHNMWLLTDIAPESPLDTVLNIGLGGEVLYHDQRVRTSMALGTSTALFSTVLDDFGATGFFVDIRPLAYRFPVGHYTIEFTPLSPIVMVPIIEGIPLVQLAYRSALTVEATF
ncbi:MAG: hypothetical protein AAFX99_07750 [Myxococcota bacterium]